MVIKKIKKSYLNISGNIYDSEFINLVQINNDKVNFGDSTLFMTEKEKQQLNNQKIKKYNNVVYLYEISGHFGMIADVVADSDKIKPHELVLPDTLIGMIGNANAYNAETAPALLAIKEKINVKKIINDIKYDDIFTVKDIKIYVYRNEKANSVLKYYEDINDFYIADGHHRFKTTQTLKFKSTMLSCIVNFKDLKLKPIHRILKNIDGYAFDISQKIIDKKFEVTDKLEKGTIKLTYKGESQFIKLKETSKDLFLNNDVLRLNTQIFRSVFRNIDDIHYVSEDNLSKYNMGKNDVLIELPKPSVKEFIYFVDNNLYMPPKSTSFTPKFPSFLIIKKYK